MLCRAFHTYYHVLTAPRRRRFISMVPRRRREPRRGACSSRWPPCPPPALLSSHLCPHPLHSCPVSSLFLDLHAPLCLKSFALASLSAWHTLPLDDPNNSLPNSSYPSCLSANLLFSTVVHPDHLIFILQHVQQVPSPALVIVSPCPTSIFSCTSHLLT